MWSVKDVMQGRGKGRAWRLMRSEESVEVEVEHEGCCDVQCDCGTEGEG